MANAMYPKFKESILQAEIDLTSVDVKMIAVDTSGGTNYTYSAAHEFLDDVVAGSIRATSPNLASKTVVDGLFDSADVTTAFASLSGGDVEAVILYVDTGSSATSRLIAYYDTGGGLPFTPTGNNVNLTFGAGGLFAL